LDTKRIFAIDWLFVISNTADLSDCLCCRCIILAPQLLIWYWNISSMYIFLFGDFQTEMMCHKFKCRKFSFCFNGLIQKVLTYMKVSWHYRMRLFCCTMICNIRHMFVCVYLYKNNDLLVSGISIVIIIIIISLH